MHVLLGGTESCCLFSVCIQQHWQSEMCMVMCADRHRHSLIPHWWCDICQMQCDLVHYLFHFMPKVANSK